MARQTPSPTNECSGSRTCEQCIDCLISSSKHYPIHLGLDLRTNYNTHTHTEKKKTPDNYPKQCHTPELRQVTIREKLNQLIEQQIAITIIPINNP